MPRQAAEPSAFLHPQPPLNVFGSVGIAERRQSLRTRRGVCIKPSHGFRLNPSATVPYTMNEKPHVRQYNEARAICASGLSPTRSNARAETEGSKGAGKVIREGRGHLIGWTCVCARCAGDRRQGPQTHSGRMQSIAHARCYSCSSRVRRFVRLRAQKRMLAATAAAHASGGS